MLKFLYALYNIKNIDTPKKQHLTEKIEFPLTKFHHMKKQCIEDKNKIIVAKNI